MLFHFDTLCFHVLSVRRMRHRAGFFDVKKRPFSAISFKIDGTGDFMINGKSITVSPKSILYIPAGADYQVNYSVNDSIVIHIADCNYTEAECITLKNHAVIEQLFLKLLDEWERTHSANRAKSIIYDILFKISEQHGQSEDSVLRRCTDYVQQHYCESDLDVPQICRHAFVSVSTIQRAFLAHLGVTPKQYIIKLRLERAIELLIEGKHSVKDVAHCCGFSDEKFFSRSFKARYGYPPSQLGKHMIV